MHTHAAGETHQHAPVAGKFLAFALAATLCLALAEFAGGYLGHSVSLLSDAFHNLSDLPAIGISWLAARCAQLPADGKRTFGYRRAGILAAFTNGLLLIVVAAGLFWEAFERFLHPVAVQEEWMIVLSLVALAINGGITAGLVRGRGDLNLRALLVHNMGDAASNVAILVGALVIRSTGAVWLDPVLGAIIGGMVLWSTIGILRDSGHILLEGLPRNMQLAEVARVILRTPGVQEIHDIHIWTLSNDLHSLSCHVRIPDMHMEESDKILASIRHSLAHEFGIHHTTIQFERAGLPESGYYMPAPARSEKL